MNENNNYYNHVNRDRIISVSDLFEEILRKIWLIIILAVVFAVLCAGYKYMSDKSKAEATTNSESYEKAQSSLTDEEIREVNSVLMLYDEVAAQEEYMEQSVLMNIDPYHEDRVIMQFALQTDAGAMTNALQAVDNYVTGGSLVTDLQGSYPDEDSAYLSELISFEQGTVAEDQPEVGNDEVISTTAIFWVQIIHSDQEEAEQLADATAKCLNSFAQELTDYFGACEIHFLNQSVTQVYDSNLKNIQSSVVSDQITQQNKIVTQTEDLSDDQIKVLEASLTGSIDEDEAAAETATADNTATKNTTKIHISRRYTLFGILIGIVVGIVLIALIYIGRGTLNIAQEMQSEFGITVLGQVHEKKPRSPLVRGWRRLVTKKKPLSLETEQRIVLTNLKNFCENHQVDRLLLAGSREDLPENTWLKEVKESLQQDQIEVEIVGGLPNSPDSLEKLNSYSCIAFVETSHTSVYKDVVREVELCEKAKKRIIGAIVLC